MKITRRSFFALSTGTAVVALGGFKAVPAFASVDETSKMVSSFTGGKEPAKGRIVLTAPEIAENGNTVPVSIQVESPMTDDDYVESVIILAEGNPNPGIATFHFTPMSGSATATTRIRLAQTQNVIAVARMKDGTVYSDRKEVKVTIGGCGG
jgi:sulfur-oxidizing protein SoxY